MSTQHSSTGRSEGRAKVQDTTKVVSRRVGRPPKPNAKSRDETRYAWTGYLVRDTVAEANYLLQRPDPNGTRDTRDMSDLVQDLVAAWISERRQLIHQ